MDRKGLGRAAAGQCCVGPGLRWEEADPGRHRSSLSSFGDEPDLQSPA